MSCELSQERDVGITEYMTADLPAFTAILKHRFRDFQVNEVDLQGQEAVLTSLDPPRLPQPLPLRDLTDEAIQSACRSFAALAGAENGKRLTALLHWVKTKHGPKAPQQEPQCAKPEQQQVQQQQQQQQQMEQQQVEQQQQQQQEEQQQQQQQQKGQAAVEAAAAAAGAAAATPGLATLSPREAVEADPSPQPDPVSSTGNARAAQPSSGPNAPASSLGKRPADILAGPAPPTQPAGCATPQGSGSPWTGVVLDKHGVAYVDLEPLPDRDTRTAVHSFFRHNPEVILLCTHTLTNESSSSSSSSNNNNPAGQAGGRGRGRGSSQPPANKKARHTNQMSGRGHQQQQQQAADVEPSQAVASADGAVAASLQAAGDTRDTPAAVTAAVADQDAATPAAPSTTVPAAGAVAAGPAIQQPLPTVAAASVTHTTAPSAGCIRVQFHPPGGHGQQQGRGQGGRGRGRGRGQPADQEWGGGPTKKYVKFVMYKENMDIQVALGSLAQGLYLPRWASPWGYAGSKDKRGVTQQWLTGFKIDPHQLAGLRHSHWCRNIRVGNFSYVAEPIELGQLAGNRFNILLRAVRASNSSPGAPADAQPSALTLRQQLEASCQAIDRHGFVNYFGLQRFGTAGVPTYRVGVALLQGKFSLAVDLIMSEGEPPAGGTSCEAPMKEGAGVAGGTKEGTAQPEMGEGGRPGVGQQQQQQQQAVKPEVIAARKAWLEGRDAAAALEAMPRWMVGERAMLDALAKSATFKKFRQIAAAKRSTAVTSGASPESLTKFMVLSEELAVEALCAIPRTLRLLYLHAWQSRVWNLAASYRIRVYGSQQAVAGDLVIPLSKEGPPGPEVQALLRSAEVPAAADCDADVSAATASTKQTSPPQETEAGGDGHTGHTSSARRARGIHVVTEEEARLGLYRIEDVVLPLPGTAVEYPTNNTAEVYRQLTAADGLNLGPGFQHSGGVGGMAAQLGAHELKGDYRRLVLRPTAFTYEVVMYDDPDDDQLMSTSRDSVEAGRPGTLRPPSVPASNTQQGPVAQSATASAGTDNGLAARDKASIVDVAMTEAEPAEKDAPATALPPPPPPPRLSELEVKQLQEAQAADLGTDGVRRPRLCGLKLSFMLPSSAYATMLIREITRRSTSRAAHQALTWEQQQQQQQVRQERVKVELVKDEPAAAEPMD